MVLWLSIQKREFHHPNWRTHIFQRGRWLNHQPVSMLMIVPLLNSEGSWWPIFLQRIAPFTFFLYGYGSIPIDTIFSGMNIHLPAILGFTRVPRFWLIPISFYDRHLVSKGWELAHSFAPNLPECPVKRGSGHSIWMLHGQIQQPTLKYDVIHLPNSKSSNGSLVEMIEIDII